MKLHTIAKRIEAIEQLAPRPRSVPAYDLAQLSNDEVETMAEFSERIVDAGRPTDIEDVARLFDPTEREQIACLLRKASPRPETPAFVGGR